MAEVIIPSGHWRTLNAGVPAEREETETELAEIRKQEGPAAPLGHLRALYDQVVMRRSMWNELGGASHPLSQANGVMDKDIACHKARNKRRAAARFRARELRRQSRASAPAPADVPALAAGSPVSPGQDESALLQYPPDYVWFCCGELANGEHHLICPRHPKNKAEFAKALVEAGVPLAELRKHGIVPEKPDLVAAIREIARN